MSDVVQRLRSSVTQCRALDRSQLLTEAADEIERLREAVHRYLADQDATLSVCNGAVTVTMDATLTDAEREAVERAADWLDRWQQTHGYHSAESGDLATLRGLLERMK